MDQNHTPLHTVMSGQCDSENGAHPHPPSRNRNLPQHLNLRGVAVGPLRFTAPVGPLSIDNSDQEQIEEQSTEGYDAEIFCPPADAKYECPICLMVAKDPTQTTCGHRFCNRCIKKWIRDTPSPVKCPVCNECLDRNSLFPDNFAKREILSLLVKCSNFKLGCSFKAELSHLQHHLDTVCHFTKVTCPKECAAVVFRKDLQRHIEEDCTRRKTKCKLCSKEISLADQQQHAMECPYDYSNCQYCNKVVLQKHRHQHSLECPQFPLECPFARFGCNDEVSRRNISEHTKNNQEKHLALLGNFVSSHLSLEDSQTLAKTNNCGPHPSTQTSGFISGKSKSELPSEGICSMDDQLLYRASPTSLAVHPLSEPLNFEHSYSIYPSGRDDSGVETLTEKSRGQDARLARHEQQILELQAKVTYLERKVKEQSSKIRHQEEVIGELETRCSNGIYYWKIQEFGKKSREAKTGTNTVLHSPGFYSSFYGYKMCVRVNLNGVESGQGTHISVFVHLMKGEYDELLNWPFTGKITLTIMDQSSSKQHIAETLEGSGNIAAFHKPSTSRNHKGFGYMEFAPLSVVEYLPYVKNDLMILRCEVEEPP